jgi:YaiO family outer membrane protein
MDRRWRLAAVCVGIVNIALFFSVPAYGSEQVVFGGYDHDSLTNNRSSWTNTYAGFQHKINKQKIFYGSARQTERHGLDDNELSGGVYLPVNPTWTFLIEASVSESHRVLPNWKWLVQINGAFNMGFGLQLGARHTDYDEVNVDSLLATGEWYSGDYRSAYTLQMTQLDGSNTELNHKLDFRYYYGEAGHSYTGIHYSTGKESERIDATLKVLTMDVDSYGVMGRHWLSSRWGLSYQAGKTDQGGFYTRTSIGAGIYYVF